MTNKFFLTLFLYSIAQHTRYPVYVSLIFLFIFFSNSNEIRKQKNSVTTKWNGKYIVVIKTQSSAMCTIFCTYKNWRHFIREQKIYDLTSVFFFNFYDEKMKTTLKNATKKEPVKSRKVLWSCKKIIANILKLMTWRVRRRFLSKSMCAAWCCG